MVAANTMAWPDGGTRCHIFFHGKPPSATLGIQSFDAAKAMCRLISLYKSLADDEISKLREEIMESKGVTYLNAKENGFLLHLACAELLEELDVTVATVSRLGRKCSGFGLNRFDQIYLDLKLGIIDIKKVKFKTPKIRSIIEKMEELVAATGKLYTAIGTVAEMEGSEKKMQRLKIISQNSQFAKINVDFFNDKLLFQRKQVQLYKDVSLWSQTLDKAVGLMAQIVCVIYARICSVFGPDISGSPFSTKKNIRPVISGPKIEDGYCLLEHRELYRTNFCIVDHDKRIMKNCLWKSGPIPKTTESGEIRFSNSPSATVNGGRTGCLERTSGGDDIHRPRNNRVLRTAPPSSVGGSGLALRYANVIIFAERCLHAPATIGQDARDALYEMLPDRLRMKLRLKLRSHWKKGSMEESEEDDDGHQLAEGWREAVEELMDWLSPMAHDTVKWQVERSVEKQKFDTKPTVLALQTLHYSDLEKAEAAIVEVLVGLSCIHRYGKRRK